MTVTSQPMILSAGMSDAAHAGVPDVAHDAHLETGKVALVLPDGVQVQQRLGGMLVLAVARVDDVRARHVGDLAAARPHACRAR